MRETSVTSIGPGFVSMSQLCKITPHIHVQEFLTNLSELQHLVQFNLPFSFLFLMNRSELQHVVQFNLLQYSFLFLTSLFELSMTVAFLFCILLMRQFLNKLQYLLQLRITIHLCNFFRYNYFSILICLISVRKDKSKYNYNYNVKSCVGFFASKYFVQDSTLTDETAYLYQLTN